MSNEDYSKMTELELRQLDWDRMTPEQFMKLKSIVGDNSNDKPGDNKVRV